MHETTRHLFVRCLFSYRARGVGNEDATVQITESPLGGEITELFNRALDLRVMDTR